MPTPATFEYRSYASGINASALALSSIRPDELPLMVNATVRKGFAQTRPGWEWQSLSFFDGAKSQYTFEQGKFQGCGQFLANGGNVAVFVVDGQVFAYNPATGYVKTYALKSGKAPFSKYSEQAWVQQRAQWVIVQDGKSLPFRSDGINAEQVATVVNPAGVTEPSVPAGTAMAEGWHRLFVADPSRRRVYVSDHDMDPISTPISFTQGTDYYLNARYFETPEALGRIMGMAFTPFQDSSTGIGPLLVFCEKGVQAYNVAVPRSQWAQQDITQTILPNVGASSYFAYSDKGSDLVFRDHEGHIRTIRNAQQLQDTGANYTNDFSIWPLYAKEDSSLRRYSHAVTFDRRTLILTHPQRAFLPDNRYNVVHRGIAVMENEHLSDKPDVWSFWTGLNICGVVTVPVNGEEALIAFCRDPDGVNRLYRLTLDGAYDKLDDSRPNGGVKRIQMTLSTSLQDYGAPFHIKTYQGASVRLTALRGEVKVCGRWQQDNTRPRRWFQHIEKHPNCLRFSKEPCGLLQMASGVQPQLALPASPIREDFRSLGLTFDVYGPAVFENLITMVNVEPPALKTNVTCTPSLQQPAEIDCDVDPLCYSAYDAETAPQPEVPLCLPL